MFSDTEARGRGENDAYERGRKARNLEENRTNKSSRTKIVVLHYRKWGKKKKKNGAHETRWQKTPKQNKTKA
jgi:hypothetical protein